MRLYFFVALFFIGSLLTGCAPSRSQDSYVEKAIRQSKGVGVIYGRVAMADGRPCAKAVLRFGYVRWGRIEYNTRETDASGWYFFDPRFHGHKGGKYAVSVAKGFGPVKSVVAPRLVQIDLSRPQKSVDFTVQESTWAEGVARDHLGKPVPNVAVHVPDIAAKGGQSISEGYCDWQGRFRLEVPPGTSVIDVVLYSNSPWKSNPKHIKARPREAVHTDLALRQ